MRMTIIGKGLRRSGTSKTSNRPYDFTPIFCCHPEHDVVGEKVEEITFNHLELTLPDIEIGDQVNVSYNKRGFIEEFSIVKKADKPQQSGNLKINS